MFKRIYWRSAADLRSIPPWRRAEFSLEGVRERVWAAVADSVGDGSKGVRGVPEQGGGEDQAPPREVCHRRATDQRDEPARQGLHPYCNSNGCLDPEQAVASRRRILERAADEREVLVPAHFGGAGAVEVRREGGGFTLGPWATAGAAPAW